MPKGWSTGWAEAGARPDPRASRGAEAIAKRSPIRSWYAAAAPPLTRSKLEGTTTRPAAAAAALQRGVRQRDAAKADDPDPVWPSAHLLRGRQRHGLVRLGSGRPRRSH